MEWSSERRLCCLDGGRSWVGNLRGHPSIMRHTHRHTREIFKEIRRLKSMDEDEVFLSPFITSCVHHPPFVICDVLSSAFRAENACVGVVFFLTPQ